MKNKNKIKLLILFYIILLSTYFSLANTQTYVTSEKAVYQFLFSIVDIISAIWYVFPMIAWKLLTNDLVYWSVLHLDTVLWQIWNFSKNIANFAIWFIFIFLIFKYLISFNDKNWSILKNYLPKIAFWALVVNSSWFIVWFLVDVSTLLIMAFWSLPWYISHSFLKWPTAEKLSIVTDFNLKTSCNSSKSYCFWWIEFIPDKTKQHSINVKKILSYENNISWPLVFLWTSIFNIPLIRSNAENNSANTNAWILYSDWTNMRLILIVLVLILFIVPMIVLIIVNLVRLFWLWIYIWFSPLIFLENIFWNKTLWNKPVFKFSNIIWLIFQPVFVIATFWFSFIFLLCVINVIKTDSNSNVVEHRNNFLKTFHLTWSEIWSIQSNYFQIQDTTHKMWDYIWWFFWYMIILLLSSFIVWSMVKLSFKASEITSWIAERSFSFVEDSLKTIPTIPTPWWFQSIWSLKKAWSFIQSIPWRRTEKQVDQLTKLFWTVQDISISDKKKYIEALKKLDKKLLLTSEDKQNINKIFEKLEKYSWKENSINSNPNTKEIIDALTDLLINKSQVSTDSVIKWIANDIRKLTSYEAKLDKILKNEITIKNFLLHENKTNES